MFKLVQPHLNGLKLRDARTSDIDRLLHPVAASKPRAKTTLTNVRNFLSGGFRYAIRQEMYSRQNPVRGCRVPKGKEPENTTAYSLEEITAMLAVLGEPAQQLLNAVVMKPAQLGFDVNPQRSLGDTELSELAVLAARDCGKSDEEIGYMVNMVLVKAATVGE
jgi:hypothetical protein